MRTIHHALLITMLVGGLAGTLSAEPAEDLFAATHKGKEESDVADTWYDALPAWVSSLTTKNEFPKTHLPYDVVNGRMKNSKTAIKYEIRDANKKQFSAYKMVPNGTDATGHTIYVATQDFGWLSWKSWPAKYIVETYPVDSNDDKADLVALAAWLYEEKENELANRVLTVVHKDERDWRDLIEAYICDKEGWELPADGLKEWETWDIEFQKKRGILVTPEEYEKQLKQREGEAEDRFKEILKERGDYKGRPPRRRSPTKLLVYLEWEIKQYKIKYGGTDFLAKEKNQETLQDILDSITDDLALIEENLKKADEIGAPGGDALEDKAKYLEEILAMDPKDMRLRSKTANTWYAYGNPEVHGNGCEHNDGIKAAIPHYLLLVEVYPNNTSFLLALGRCYQALEDSKPAHGYYDRVIEIDGTKGNAVTAKALKRSMEQRDQNRAAGKDK